MTRSCLSLDRILISNLTHTNIAPNDLNSSHHPNNRHHPSHSSSTPSNPLLYQDRTQHPHYTPRKNLIPQSPKPPQHHPPQHPEAIPPTQLHLPPGRIPFRHRRVLRAPHVPPAGLEDEVTDAAEREDGAVGYVDEVDSQHDLARREEGGVVEDVGYSGCGFKDGVGAAGEVAVDDGGHLLVGWGEVVKGEDASTD
ncbi:hypothetical protein CCUS01_02513 [Colletotrichum cuscutae]|uniref:Uncharacterized protein n=1 Tax=Colletotrichum cuscutae TaxID=1209917 RepID=A0AAI9YDB4_9PEZI|nr:hypothetical protein CCUS01_02513 [Colletotrichum cuscutae]